MRQSNNRKSRDVTAFLYEQLSRDDNLEGESYSIGNQELLCRGWFLPPNTYDCGSFVVNGTAVVGKEKTLRCRTNQNTKSASTGVCAAII